MRNKMINHGIAIIGIAILILLSIGSASAPPYGGPDAEVEYEDINLQEMRMYSSDPADYRAGRGFKLINTQLKRGLNSVDIYIGPPLTYGDETEYITFNDKTINEMFPLFDIRSRNVSYRTVVYLSVHPKDPAKPKADKYFRLDGIEGLMSLEEAQAIVAQEEAATAKKAATETERAAQAEAARQAREEANRYDPSKFTVVPNYFSPADYTSTDLFKAVSASKNLEIASNKMDALNRQARLMGRYFLQYKSDLTFVRQNGTDITFSSDDNAITQNMSIDQRSGLQAGQKVRVYYEVMRTPLTTWDVIAIERR